MASVCLSLEDTLTDFRLGRLSIPTGVDVAEFIASGGRVQHVITAPSLGTLVEGWKASKKAATAARCKNVMAVRIGGFLELVTRHRQKLQEMPEMSGVGNSSPVSAAVPHEKGSPMRHLPRLLRAALVLGMAWTLAATGVIPARADDASRPKRVLLIGQKPDGHPFTTHEYMPGMVLLAKLLQPVEGVQTIVVQADGAWERGPELLDGADAAVLFVSEGARWIHADPERLAAFRRLAERGGGLVCWHWGMGCKDARYIDGFVDLFGACHGGPDRRYKVLTATAEPVESAEGSEGPHPVLRGVEPVRVHEEFYYRLKLPKEGPPITPLVRVEIEGERHTVGWAWERADGGRSFGFSGGHFHENWKHPAYRRLAVQGVLWTLELPIPKDGQPVAVTEADLKLKPREKAK